MSSKIKMLIVALAYTLFIVSTISLTLTLKNSAVITQATISEQIPKQTLPPVDRFSNTEELHWTNMPISFSFGKEADCGAREAKRIRNAFAQLENETNKTVSFVETQDSANITITCESGFNKSLIREDNYIKKAEAFYSSKNNVITNATITFFDTGGNKISSSCATYPDTEIHEILHTFGFEHVEDKSHIMSPIQLSCPKSLNQDIIDELKIIYQ